MASSLIKGIVTLNDGTQVAFSAGPRERILAERHFKINLKSLQAQEIGEEYMVFLAYLALQKQGDIAKDTSFDKWLEDNLSDYEVDEDPELLTPRD